jgi:adenosylcobinamide-GDP ribazoletransferase
MRYVADEDGSKSKPLANNQSKTDLVILLATCLPIFFLLHWQKAILIIATLIVVRYAAKFYFQKQIGGYTGDCLGAAQQISEMVIYAVLLIHLGQLNITW